MSDVKNRITKTTYHVVMYHQDFEDTREYDNKFAATSEYLDCRHDWRLTDTLKAKNPTYTRPSMRYIPLT